MYEIYLIRESTEMVKMMMRAHSQRKIFQFFAFRPNENNSSVGEKDIQNNLRYLQVEAKLLQLRSGKVLI